MDSKKQKLNTAQLIKLNRFEYNKLGDHTIVDARTLRKVFALKSEYKQSETVEFEFSTGASWIYGPTSYLVFEAQAQITGGDATTKYGFGVLQGSAMNFFESMVLKNGEEIERIDDLNVASYYLDQYTKDNEFLYHSSGTATGYRSSTDVNITTPTRFCIPMSRLGGFFSNHNQLIPSFAIAGSRLQLKLASPATALKETGTAATTVTYTISNAAIMCDTFDLVDEARTFLTKKASTERGLIFTYPSWSHQATSVNAITRISSNVGIPVAHVLYAFSVIRTQAITTDQRANSFHGKALTSTTKWRYRLGSIMYPDQQVDNIEESYMMAQHTFDRVRDTDTPNSVRLADFTSAGLIPILAQSFERSHLAKLSGLPLNSGGRSLYLEWSDTANSDNLQIDTYTCYVKVCAAFSDNRVHVMH